MADLHDYIIKTRSFFLQPSIRMLQKWKASGDQSGGPDRDLPNSPDMFSGNFPEGLRVLLFDEDRQYLHILEKHLEEFQYEGSYFD